MSDSDDETNEGKQSYHELMRTPRVLRRLVSKISVPRKREYYIALVFDSVRLVNQYTPYSPTWLRTELAVSLLCELDELDGMGDLFQQSVITMINIADSGSFRQIKTHNKCPCGFC